MRTRPPKRVRAAQHTIGDLARKTLPAPRYVNLTDVFADVGAVREGIDRARNHRAPPTLDFDGLLILQGMFGSIVPGDWLPPPHPPLCLNLNLSAPLPTLESL